MNRVLVVSPSFPPTSAADLHRVRTSLPHFADFGWTPHVLAIDSHAHGGLVEPELLATLPAGIPVTRTSALPNALTRMVGIGNAGLRAVGHLYTAGARLIARESIDLVYFSTTMFPVVTLGRLWKRRLGTPFVVDIQDPWKSDYRGAGRASGLKARAARFMHGVLEPFAMREADGVVSVSRAYIDTLQRRYPGLSDESCAVIPFGASASDFDIARAMPWQNNFFDRNDGRTHAVAVGRGGRDLRQAADMLFGALRLLQDRGVALRPVHLWFIGTDYSAAAQDRTIAPAAETAGISEMVTESPGRVPYLQALRLLQDSHLTIVLGSDDSAYSPSKVYPYLLAGKPLVAVLHAGSPVAPLLERASVGIVARFGTGGDTTLEMARLADSLGRLFGALPEHTRVAPELLEPLSARELTRRQCDIFDLILRRHARGSR